MESGTTIEQYQSAGSVEGSRIITALLVKHERIVRSSIIIYHSMGKWLFSRGRGTPGSA